MPFEKRRNMIAPSETSGARLCALLFTGVFLLLCPFTTAAQQPGVAFEDRWGMALTDADWADILHLGKLLLDRPIKKVSARFMLPTSIPIIIVQYEDDILGTFVVHTWLEIYKRDPSHWKQEYLDSLRISSGTWATKPEFLRREVLRLFRIDGAEITLRYADNLSYREVGQLLKTINNKSIVWEATASPRIVIALQDITYIDLSEPARLYGITVAPQSKVVVYSISAEINGDKLVVRHVGMAIP